MGGIHGGERMAIGVKVEKKNKKIGVRRMKSSVRRDTVVRVVRGMGIRENTNERMKKWAELNRGKKKKKKDVNFAKERLLEGNI